MSYTINLTPANVSVRDSHKYIEAYNLFLRTFQDWNNQLVKDILKYNALVAKLDTDQTAKTAELALITSERTAAIAAVQAQYDALNARVTALDLGDVSSIHGTLTDYINLLLVGYSTLHNLRRVAGRTHTDDTASVEASIEAFNAILDADLPTLTAARDTILSLGTLSETHITGLTTAIDDINTLLEERTPNLLADNGRFLVGADDGLNTYNLNSAGKNDAEFTKLFSAFNGSGIGSTTLNSKHYYDSSTYGGTETADTDRVQRFSTAMGFTTPRYTPTWAILQFLTGTGTAGIQVEQYYQQWEVANLSKLVRGNAVRVEMYLESGNTFLLQSFDASDTLHYAELNGVRITGDSGPYQYRKGWHRVPALTAVKYVVEFICSDSEPFRNVVPMALFQDALYVYVAGVKVSNAVQHLNKTPAQSNVVNLLASTKASRGTISYHENPDGSLVQVPSGEVRRKNAMRLDNRVSGSDASSSFLGYWGTLQLPVTQGIADPLGGNNAIRCICDARTDSKQSGIIFLAKPEKYLSGSVNELVTCVIALRASAGSISEGQTVLLSGADVGASPVSLYLTTEWTWHAVHGTSNATFANRILTLRSSQPDVDMDFEVFCPMGFRGHIAPPLEIIHGHVNYGYGTNGVKYVDAQINNTIDGVTGEVVEVAPTPYVGEHPLLLEKASENLIKIRDLQFWAHSGIALTDKITLGVENELGTIGVTLQSAGASWHRLTQLIYTSASSGVVYCGQAFFKIGTSGRFLAQFRHGSSEARVRGTVASPYAASMGHIESGDMEFVDLVHIGNDIYRVRIKYTGVTEEDGSYLNFGIGPDSDTAGENIEALSAMVTIGDFTSYVPPGYPMWKDDNANNDFPNADDLSTLGLANASTPVLHPTIPGPFGGMDAWHLVGTGTGYHTKTNITGVGDSKEIWARTVSGTGKLCLLEHNTSPNALRDLSEVWQKFTIEDTTFNGSGANNVYVADYRGGSDLLEVLVWMPQIQSGGGPVDSVGKTSRKADPALKYLPVPTFADVDAVVLDELDAESTIEGRESSICSYDPATETLSVGIDETTTRRLKEVNYTLD